MPRPNVLRRAGAVDRQTASGAFLLAAVVLLGTVGFAHGPLPASDGPDPHAARDLVALMRAGERGSWLVDYDFTRKLANGRVLRARMEEARRPALHVLISGASMTFDRDGRSFDCSLVDDRSQCLESTGSGVLPASEVMRVAIATGAYEVSRLPDAVIAGDAARCFLVRATGHGILPDLGVETRTCLAGDGVALGQLVLRATGILDDRVATSASRRPSTRAIIDIARSFDPEGAIPTG